ncbi:MAG TPA: hypothetical protein VMG10_01075 [Gemmataceae bacterium]|nr:hypothetical protein [Gemmataceae bacterium]
MTLTLLTLALSLPAAPAPAPKMERPKGLAPRVVMIELGDEGKLKILEIASRMVQVQKVVTAKTADGKERQVTRTVMVPVFQQMIRTVDLDGVRVFGVNGKKIETKEVRKQLAKPMPALVSVDGNPVDPFYLRVAREGTLVLVIPPQTGIPGGNVKIMPAPKLPPLPRENAPKLPPLPREK